MLGAKSVAKVLLFDELTKFLKDNFAISENLTTWLCKQVNMALFCTHILYIGTRACAYAIYLGKGH